MCTASKTWTRTLELYNHKDWGQSGVSKSVLLRYRCRRGAKAFFANKHTDFSEGKRFIIIHMAASYANGSSDAFYGTNATGEGFGKRAYNYCVNKPEIPEVAMSFSKPNVKAYVDGNVQRTENIQFQRIFPAENYNGLTKGSKAP